uniref:Type II secretion system protein GspC N-terminal domain-containing protein n=1 Tax=uncultured Thiotrichaceae bacterium TaxID=298394 RepID=A0A6S6UFN1_9GAMM|nr:MAG: Unknown protein [uncultured Thiotrichaceae bacterium]
MIDSYAGIENITGILADFRCFCMQKLKQQQLFDRVFDRLPDHVTLLLIIISGFLLARLTWMMFPSDPSIRAAAPVEQTDDTGVSVLKAHATSKNVGKEIADYHLLGVYQVPKPVKAAPPPVAKKPTAPKPKAKPREKLSLVGVYSLSEEEGVAIINAKNKQEVVGLDETVGETGAILKKVYADRVDISWDGEIETLKMPNIDRSALGAVEVPPGQQLQPEPVIQQASFNQQANAPVSKQAKDINAVNPSVQPTLQGGLSESSPQRATGVGNQQQATQPAQQENTTTGAASAAPSASLSSFKQEIINNNINLLQVIRPSPRRENGQLIGFAIKPGTNRALFNQTGLKSGDVVTAINGMPLNSNSAGRQAMQSLSTASGASLTVLRAGQETMVQLAF